MEWIETKFVLTEEGRSRKVSYTTHSDSALYIEHVSPTKFKIRSEKNNDDGRPYGILADDIVGEYDTLDAAKAVIVMIQDLPTYQHER